MNLDKNTVFLFLDDLRNSGKTNMFGAGSYLEQVFNIDRHSARDYIVEWMETFSQRRPNE